MLVKLVFEELGAFGASMAVVNAEPFRIFFQIYSNFVLVALPVKTLMGNDRI